MKKNLKVLTEGAIMIALSAVLSVIPIWDMPLGGKITFVSALPIAVYIYRRGTVPGFTAAFLYSIIQLILGLDNLAYATGFPSVIAIIFGDYIAAYTLYGIAALFRNKRITKNDRLNNSLCLSFGVISAFILRFACHLVSGAVVWYSLTKEWYSDDPGHIVFSLSPWAYSGIYNGAYLLPEMIITTIAAFLLASVVNPQSENLRY